ncbi:MAG: DUF2109 family protein [Methanomicrobiales archaeon]|nr:DUF2109 family protein [Methanomicrobiales archaeon]
MIHLYLIAAVALLAALRVVAERRTMRKLPYLNVLSFAIAGSLVLIIPHPLAILASAAYFIASTLESNAISSTYAGGGPKDG